MIRRSVRGAACLITAAFLAVGPVTGCGVIGSDDSDGRVALDFFQFKPEAIETFNKIIADFEREHPNIRVRQNHVPNADTALRTRLVRNDIPDVLVVNANATYGELASAKVFYNFADDPLADTVTPAILDIVKDLGTGGEGELNALPFANNADGVIYNRDLFAKHGVAEPKTWNDLVAAANTFKAAGVVPVYATLKEAWTTLPAFNAISATLPPPDFFDRREEGKTTFAAAYPPVAQRFKQLFDFAQPDKLSRGYNDGNQAFAKGEAAMYLQGSWAIPTIRSFKPTFEIGSFALPVDNPADTKLVSGVDVAVAMPRKPSKKAESLEFVRYLMRPEVIEAYAEEQSAIPTLKGTQPKDPALAALVPYFTEGRLVGFTDHHIPPAIPLQQISQQFLIDGDQAAFLRSLDREWNKFARRRR
jgi:raffinose/stachyose/melibiose transport system substrate-binding protein